MCVLTEFPHVAVHVILSKRIAQALANAASTKAKAVAEPRVIFDKCNVIAEAESSCVSTAAGEFPLRFGRKSAGGTFPLSSV